MNEQKVNIRSIKVNGITYVRVADVVELLRAIGATEDIDVRNRLEKAALIITIGESSVDPI